jgi:ring-1,2-phenylacetyl-CoA epoxidase subunit PaaE
MAAKFHSLAIVGVRRETPEAVSIAFGAPEALRDAFAFTCGQYLTLRATLDGEEQRRSYSICSGMDDGELRVAIKRVEGGRFSSFANAELRVGGKIDVMPPSGKFGVTPQPGAARRYVAFAAGSGITPILSIIKSVLAREPASHFTLFYGNRSAASIMFKDALEDLKDRAIGRLSVHHILSREAQDIALLNGRIDAAKAAALMRTVGLVSAVDQVFLCGPVAMTAEIARALLAIGVAAQRIQTEVFTPAEGAAPPHPSAPPRETRADGAKLTLRIDGVTHAIAMRADETVLEAALRHGLDMPWSCRAGMCCTCRARLVEGVAAMDQNYSLEAWEMRAGFVLTCQLRPASAALTVDFDAM